MVPKINNDSESKRLQRNMTDTQKKNSNYVKEGKLVNAFVKDPQLSLDETIDTLVISHEPIDLPPKVFETEQKKSSFILDKILLFTVDSIFSISFFKFNF